MANSTPLVDRGGELGRRRFSGQPGSGRFGIGDIQIEAIAAKRSRQLAIQSREIEMIGMRVKRRLKCQREVCFRLRFRRRGGWRLSEARPASSACAAADLCARRPRAVRDQSRLPTTRSLRLCLTREGIRRRGKKCFMAHTFGWNMRCPLRPARLVNVAHKNISRFALQSRESTAWRRKHEASVFEALDPTVDLPADSIPDTFIIFSQEHRGNPIYQPLRCDSFQRGCLAAAVKRSGGGKPGCHSIDRTCLQ